VNVAGREKRCLGGGDALFCSRFGVIRADESVAAVMRNGGQHVGGKRHSRHSLGTHQEEKKMVKGQQRRLRAAVAGLGPPRCGPACPRLPAPAPCCSKRSALCVNWGWAHALD